MTLVVLVFVVAVAVAASALWWIHRDGLAVATVGAAPTAAEVAAPRSEAPATTVRRAAPRTNVEVRAWGRANGHTVAARGPLPKALVAAFAAAHCD